MAGRRGCVDCGGVGWLPNRGVNGEGVRQCPCAVLLAIAAAMDPGLRQAPVEKEHFEVLKELRSKSAAHVLFKSGRADMLAMRKAYWVAHQVVDPAGVSTVTDAGLAKNYYSDPKDDDAGQRDSSNREQVCLPQLLVIELNVQRSSHRSAAPALLEAVTTRLQNGRHECWLFSVSGNEFGEGSPAYSAELRFIVGQTFRTVPLRILDDESVANPFRRSASTAVQRGRGSVSTTSSATAVRAPLRATAAGRCLACGGPIAKGDEFVWFDTNKGRVHPACVQARAS